MTCAINDISYNIVIANYYKLGTDLLNSPRMISKFYEQFLYLTSLFIYPYVFVCVCSKE